MLQNLEFLIIPRMHRVPAEHPFPQLATPIQKPDRHSSIAGDAFIVIGAVFAAISVWHYVATIAFFPSPLLLATTSVALVVLGFHLKKVAHPEAPPLPQPPKVNVPECLEKAIKLAAEQLEKEKADPWYKNKFETRSGPCPHIDTKFSEFAACKVAASSTLGMESIMRPHMIESYWCGPLKQPEGILFAVIQGNEGFTPVPYTAREAVHDHLKETLEEELKKDQSDEAVWHGLRKAFDFLDKTCQEEGIPYSCTMVVCVLLKSNLWVASLGLCGAVLNKNGEAVQLSKSQSLAYPEVRKELEKKGGKITSNNTPDPNGIAVDNCFYKVDNFPYSHSIGGHPPSVSPLPMIIKYPASDLKGCQLILGSEGLWQQFSGFGVTQEVQKCQKKPLTEVTRHLVQRAYLLGSTKNITSMVIHFPK